MAAHHHRPWLLHELLKEDQEPFHLKTFVTQRRSNLNSNSNNNRSSTATTLHHLKKRSSSSRQASSSCFFSFNSSPNKSPFLDFHSPAQSPCKNNLLHIPPNVVEAAMRVQRQQQQQSKKPKHIGLGLFGSLLKRLRDRSANKNKKTRALGDNNNGNIRVSDTVEETHVRISSCSCNSSSKRRVMSSISDWTESSKDPSKSVDLWASSSSSDNSEEEAISTSYGFGFPETLFCGDCPFRFSLHRSNSSSSSGSPTPDFCSPAASPSRHVTQEKNFEDTNPGNVQGEEEDKEQCSPVSVLDPPFEEDAEHESRDVEEEDDYDPDRSYANIQRARRQLLNRLRRFEKLAELDPIELERKLLEGSDDENLEEREASEEEEPLSLYRKHNVDTFVTEVLNRSSLVRLKSSRTMSADMKRLVSDLVTEEKGEVVNKEAVFGRVCNCLDSWKDFEANTIDMIIEFDLKGESNGWRKFSEQMEEIAAEIELEICGLLLEELTEEVFYIREVQLCVQ